MSMIIEKQLRSIADSLDKQNEILAQSNKIQAMQLIETLKKNKHIPMETIQQIAHEFGVTTLVS